jgi:hypothetical protein
MIKNEIILLWCIIFLSMQLINLKYTNLDLQKQLKEKATVCIQTIK